MKSAKFAVIFAIFIFIVVFFGILPAVFLDVYRSRAAMGLSLRPIDLLPTVLPVVIILFILPSMIGPIKVLLKTVFSDQELREKGIDGQARILEVIQTGELINYQPVLRLKLEISTSGQPSYIIEDKFMVPQIGLHLVQLGSIIPVKVDPKNPKKVAINAWSFNSSKKNSAQSFQGEPINNQGFNFQNMFQGGMPVNFKNLGAVGNMERGPVVNGKKGEAKIVSLSDTGKTKNGQKVFAVKYEIKGDEITPYPLEREMPLPDIALQVIRVGSVYPCEVDRDDPTHIMVAVTSVTQKPM